MPPRSYLFVPADRPERFEKAMGSGADAVIIDLEDAVAPDRKDHAREALQGWLTSMAQASMAKPPGEGSLIVRVNAEGAWQDADLALCRACPLVQAVMVPKAESAAAMEKVARAVGDKPMVALIETAQGFENRREIAAAPGVSRLAFGSIDFQADLGIAGEDEALLMFRSGLVLASRLAGLPAPVDGVTTAVEDAGPARADAVRARALGFGGKLCIHPRQVVAVNEAFSPSAQELDWARRVLQAAQDAGGAAVAVDGKMVDKPVILRAQALLAQRR